MAVKSKKKILGLIKLQIPAGKANPSPPVGPALGQKGLNIMEFCKAFNAATQKMEPGIPVPVVITAYEDKSFTFITKLPPVAYYIKQAAKIKSASKEPGKDYDGSGQGNCRSQNAGSELFDGRSRHEHG